jgi:hypothetical protein
MKAMTDLVLTKDRTRVVPLGDPDGDSFAWVACKGEELPPGLPGMKKEETQKARVPAENKQRKPAEDK